MKYPAFTKTAPVLSILLLLTPLAVADNHSAKTEYYHVEDGKVDGRTLIGYNVFHQVCVSCHGVGGSGTESIPDLTRSMERLTPDLFRIKTLHKFAIKFTKDDWINMERSMFEEIRKHEQRKRGELADMPRWKNNPMVTSNVNNIYRYLKARADGVLGPYKPGLLKE